MDGRRVRLCWSAIEQLEGRDVPSALAPIQSAHVEFSDILRGAAEMVSTSANVEGSRITPAHSAEVGLDDQARVARVGNGNVVDPTPVGRNDTETADDNKVSRSQNIAPRELWDPTDLATRRADFKANAPADDFLAIGQETISGGSAAAASESADGFSFAVWGLGAAMPLVMSVSILPGSLLGSDGRARESWADNIPPGSVGYVGPELEVSGQPPQRPRTPADHGGDKPSQLDRPVLASDRETPAWAQLVEGTLHADWEVFDRELQQFLSGLHRIADDPDGYGARGLWPLGLGAAMALVLAHRASNRRRRLSRRTVNGALQVSTRRPVSFGPWPLSPR
jgi:hypothetical protein